MKIPESAFPPRATRSLADEHKYRSPTNDPSIEPDRVSPSVEGYFRIPAVWIGSEPNPNEAAVMTPHIHHEVVLRKLLKCGIRMLVLRDGTFLFDFADWERGPVVVIPGYTRPGGGTYTAPIETHRQQERAEEIAVLRAQVMNVHQACLTTADSVVRRRAAPMGFPVTAWSTFKAISFAEAPHYSDFTEDPHGLARNVLNNSYGIPRERALSRRVVELDVVEYSIALLDKVLMHEDAALVQLVEGAYIAACRSGEKRFGESITLAWGVCEQLIWAEWSKLLDEHRRSDAERMDRERRKKLGGRDYTASVIVEMLELHGRIDRELYRLLEIARKARNKWAHEMKSPTQRDVLMCMRALRTLLARVRGIDLTLQHYGRGGVPQYPIWMWEQAKASRF